MKSRLALFFGILVVGAAIATWLVVRPRGLAVGFQPAAANYPMMHALEAGFFERQGLHPKTRVFQSATDAQNALLGNTIFLDAVIPVQDIAVIESEHPGSLGIIALLLSDIDNPIDFLVVPKDSVIKSPTQLGGKTVVVFPGTFVETLTRLALDKLGVQNVKFLKLPPGEMVQALQTGRADAGVVYDPVASLAEHQGWGRIIERGLWEKQLLSPLVIGAYAYNIPEARKNPDLARRFWVAIERAIADARINPLAARRPLVTYLKVPESLLPKLASPRVEMADEVDAALIRQTIQFYVENGILSKSVDLSPLLRKP